MQLNQRPALACSEWVAAFDEEARWIAQGTRNIIAIIRTVCDASILELEDPEQREGLELVTRQFDRLARTLADTADGSVDHSLSVRSPGAARH
jgi:hypothetical protein